MARPIPFGMKALFSQGDIQSPGRRFILEQIVDLLGRFKPVAGGHNKSNPPPVVGDDWWNFVLKFAKLKFIVPIAGSFVIGLRGNQVSAGE